MYQKLFAWIQKYERHLSALAMIAGFVCDNLFFTRIDIERTQILLAIYAAACFIAIPFLHFIEARVARGKPRPRGDSFFLSRHSSRSEDSGAPSLFSMVARPFSARHGRFFFSFSLFFSEVNISTNITSDSFSQAFFSFLHSIPARYLKCQFIPDDRTQTFLESGLIAICIFVLFTILLRILGRERFLVDVKRIRIGALGVLVVINLFYFTNILPPLPLSATTAGIYHSVWRVPGEYIATSEAEIRGKSHNLGFAPTCILFLANRCMPIAPFSRRRRSQRRSCIAGSGMTPT